MRSTMLSFLLREEVQLWSNSLNFFAGILKSGLMRLPCLVYPLSFFYFADIDYGEYTMRKRVPIVLLCCTMLYGAVYAKTIGFACIYNSDAPAEAAELTTALETELFDFCFDHGMVATSVEYIVGKYEQYKDNASLIKRFDSSLDYVVALYCEYKQAIYDTVNRQRLAIEWKTLQWKFIDFSSQKVIFEKKIDPETIPEIELRQKIKSAGKAIGTSMLEIL